MDLSQYVDLIADLRKQAVRGRLAVTRHEGRLLLRWKHPTGPFTYLLGPDDSGSWGWAMRNDIADPPGAYIAQGELPAADDPTNRTQVIADFFKLEIDDLSDDND